MNRESLLARHAFRPVKGFASEQTQPQYAPDCDWNPFILKFMRIYTFPSPRRIAASSRPSSVEVQAIAH